MHFSNNKVTRKLRFSGNFPKAATKHRSIFLSVRTEQPLKVCSEERLKIKVSDDFSQSRLSNFN